MTGLSFAGLIILVLIIFIVSFNIHKEPSLEFFNTDNSNNKTYTNTIIYDTIPYGSSSLFYDYIYRSPYYYNPLDYWLNPYFYYSWYNPSFSISSSSPNVRKVKHIKRTRRRYH
jgi:hypothetical protein